MGAQSLADGWLAPGQRRHGESAMSSIRNHRATGLPHLSADDIAEVRLRRYCGEPLKSIERAMGRPVRYYAYGGKTRAERIAADPTYLGRHQVSKRASGRRCYNR